MYGTMNQDNEPKEAKKLCKWVHCILQNPVDCNFYFQLIPNYKTSTIR